MKRIGSVVLLVLVEIALIVSLARDANKDGVVTQFSLGVHAAALALVFLAIYFVRSRAADPAGYWPEDLDDVWPDDPDTGVEGQAAPEEAWCPEKSVHPEHFFEFAGDTFQCPGQDTFVPEDIVQPTEILEPVAAPRTPVGDPWMTEPKPDPADHPCGSRRFHKAHEWAHTDEAGTEPVWCPGYAGRKKAAASGTP